MMRGSLTTSGDDGGEDKEEDGRQGRGRGGRQECLILAAVLGVALVLQVVVTVLAHAHRGRDLQPLDLRLEAAAPGEGREGQTAEIKPWTADASPHPLNSCSTAQALVYFR